MADLQSKVKYLEELDKAQKEEVSPYYFEMECERIVQNSYSDPSFVQCYDPRGNIDLTTVT